MVKIFVCPLLVKEYNMYELIPLVQTWLEKEGFAVSVLANRVDGVKKTGIFSSERIRLLFKDYPNGCSVELEGSERISQCAKDYFLQLPPKMAKSQKEVIIKEREIVKIRCPYCRALYDESNDKCPHCSGTR